MFLLRSENICWYITESNKKLFFGSNIMIGFCGRSLDPIIINVFKVVAFWDIKQFLIVSFQKLNNRDSNLRLYPFTMTNHSIQTADLWCHQLFSQNGLNWSFETFITHLIKNKCNLVTSTVIRTDNLLNTLSPPITARPSTPLTYLRQCHNHWHQKS